MASTFEDQDHYGILQEMKNGGSFVDGIHVVYKAGTHGDKYLDKDLFLKQAWVAQRVAELLATGIEKNSIIIAPETRSDIKLVELVGQITGCSVVTTKKSDQDEHTIDEPGITSMNWRKVILIDDIFNNGITYYQIQAFLAARWLNIDEFRVMVDRNPEKSGTTGIPMVSLAATQMDQWEENKVPMNLLKQKITTKLGKARNWVPKAGQTLTEQFYLERQAKEQLGFRLDDGLVVAPGTERDYTLIKDPGQTLPGTVIRMEIDDQGTFVVTA